MSNKRPGDRMWQIVLLPIAVLLVVAGCISQHSGISWMCLFLSLTCDIVFVTIYIVSALDDNLYRDVDDARQELQRQADSLQRENQRLEETNRELEKKIRSLEEANMRMHFLKWD